MVYLILAVISSMSVSVIMRVSETHVRNNVSMFAFNYLMCTALALLFTGMRLPHGFKSGFAIGMGVVNGWLYLASFLLLQLNVRENGVVLSATFMKLGVLVPVVLSTLFFREIPTGVQAAGIAAALVAIAMLQFERGKGGTKNGLGLLLLLLGGGMTDAMSKLYEEWGPSAFADHFLFYTFVFAFLLCVFLCAIKKQRLCSADAAFGLLIGVPNYFSSRFLLLSLGSMPAVVAYPVYSVGTIALVTLAGMAVFGERLSKKQLAAMGLILAALVLLNLP